MGEGLRWLTIAILAPYLLTFFERKENGVAQKFCLIIEDFKATPRRTRAGQGWSGCHRAAWPTGKNSGVVGNSLIHSRVLRSPLSP